MVLAFALKKEKHRRMGSSSNPLSTFMHHIGNVEFGKFDRRSTLTSNDRFHTPSHIQIKEISEGAQKLNQILNACYDGLNCDKYSVEIAQQLHKGAMDLEESLRMLVNLQEASEHIISPKRKQRIRLVEVEDDNSETIKEVNKQKKLDQPKFYFDRPSRNSVENVRQGTKGNLVKQRQLALSSPTEPQKINSEKEAIPTPTVSVSHRRTASCGAITSTIATFPNPNTPSSSASQLQKGRLPNVIAKLMGLEEFSPPIEPKSGGLNEPRVNQGASVGKGSKENLKEITKKIEPVTMNSEKLYPQTAKQKELLANTLVTKNHTTEKVIPKGKPHLEDHKNAKILVKKHENKMRQDKVYPKKKKIIVTAGTKEKVFEDDLQRMALKTFKYPKDTYTKQEKATTKEKINANDKLLMMNNQANRQHDSPCQPRHKLRKSESKDLKLQANEKEQFSAKNKLQAEKPKGTEVMLKKNSSKFTHDVMNLQKKLPITNHAPVSENSKEAVDAMPAKALKSSPRENLTSQGHITNLKPKIQKSPKPNIEKQKLTPTDTETDEEITKVVIMESANITTTQNKVDGTESPKSVISRTLMEELSSGSHPRHDKSSKQQALILKEPEQINHERKEAEERIGPTKEAGENIRPLNPTEDMLKITEFTPIQGDSVTEEYQMLKEPKKITFNANIQNITTEASDSLKASTVLLSEDQSFQSSENSVQIKGLMESRVVDVSKSLQQEQQKSPKSDTQVSLTENENHLKQLVIKSRLFVNAAEALFKLQIPVSILHSSANNCRDEDSKLLLDCGYEVMKRKGKIQELTLNPYLSISIRSNKMKCLDNLVKELHGDLETIKFYDENGNAAYDNANFLHTFLQKDFQDRNSDINCMWDFGWSDAMFACHEKEEVIRDVEKHLLNGIISEITRDFLNLNAVT